MYHYLLLLTVVRSQELPSPLSLLPPSDFDYHFSQQHLQEPPKPTKQGPVLFPNDAPPPPRPPLVVTSRPLAESVARSELNNTAAASTYVRPVWNGRFGVQKSKSQYNTDGSQQDLDYNEGQNYAFSYTVRDQKTGDDFSHKQEGSGSATNGEYRVRLPDGRIQIVSYTADDGGYKANVRYDDDTNYSKENYINNYKLNSDTNNIYNLNPNSNNNYNLNSNINDDYNLSPNTNNNYNLNSNINEDYNLHPSTNNNYNLNANYNPVVTNINNYDYNKVNYRDEIPVKENQYDSNEYYDYSAENYKNPQLFQPSTTLRPFVTTTIKPYVPSTITPFKYTTISPVPVTTVRPSYEEIKHLFTTPNYVNNIEINSPSAYKFDDVVVIGGNSQNYLNDYKVSTTPTSYILSSVKSIHQNSKPILSDSFLSRINKYLTFK